MILSVIDIGTNTMLMLIAEYDGSISDIKTLLDLQRIPRLGKGVDKNRNISPESINKAVSLLNEFINISKKYNAEKIIATATSFLRDADNRNEFTNKIKSQTGLDIEILSGSDEAKWTFWGSVFDKLQVTGSRLQVCTIDIGGGSTEISISNELADTLTKETILKQKIQYFSLDIGSVRLKEKFRISQPPTNESISMTEDYINKELDKLNISLNSAQLIGVAGTITTLAALKLNLLHFDKDKIENIDIFFDEVEEIFEQLVKKNINELNQMGDYMEGRSDIIVTGKLILKTFMRKFGFKKIKVSTKGLRYGIFLREAISN